MVVELRELRLPRCLTLREDPWIVHYRQFLSAGYPVANQRTLPDAMSIGPALARVGIGTTASYSIRCNSYAYASVSRSCLPERFVFDREFI